MAADSPRDQAIAEIAAALGLDRQVAAELADRLSAAGAAEAAGAAGRTAEELATVVSEYPEMAQAFARKLGLPGAALELVRAYARRRKAAKP